MATKQVNLEAFTAIIPKIWRTTQEVEIEILRDNIFGFHFRNQTDRKRVLAGGPWSFDGSILMLEEPRDVGELSKIGKFLGEQIRVVREIDAGASGDCLGKYIRVRVVIVITKPLQRFFKVKMGGFGKAVVMLLRYERLPEYCFECGLVGHPLVEGTQGRENVGPDNQEIARLGKTGGDVGGEVVKDLGVAPLTEKLCTEVVIDAVGGDLRTKLEEGLGGAVLSEVAASPFVFVAKEPSRGKGSPKKGDVSEVGTAAKLNNDSVWVKTADMIIESVDTKSWRWKGRARDMIDKDSMIVPRGTRRKRIGSILSEEVVVPEKIRRTDSVGLLGQPLWGRFLFEDSLSEAEECKQIVESRSRVAWLKYGDRNIRYFHSQASKRKKNNEIKGLMNNQDFRPISICNVIYKIIAKVMANRLRGVLGDLIAKTQSVFVPSRSIFDNVIVGFECIHAMKQKHKGRGGLRFRNLCTFNQALLDTFNQGRFIRDLYSLAARVLKGCYFPATSLLKAKASSSGSFVWKSLLWGREVLSMRSRWRVRRGSSILGYCHRWLPRPSTFKVISPSSLGMNLTVDQLKSGLGGWNIALLQQHFLPVDIEAILSLPTGTTTGDDLLLWHHTKDWESTVKSGYFSAVSSCSGPSSSDGGLIRIFLWRASLSWLPTLMNLEARRVPVEQVWCLLCKKDRVWFRRNKVVHGQLLLPAGDILAWSSAFLNEFMAASSYITCTIYSTTCCINQIQQLLINGCEFSMLLSVLS
ncbi:hypothetical protein ACOSQ3_024384 [Xanthoceras sorbifolium]